MPAPSPTDDPLYSGELRARAELTLAAILRALLIVLPGLFFVAVFSNTKMSELLVLGTTVPYVLALFFLQRRGHFALCVHAAVFGLIVFGALIAALYGSVRSVGTVGQVAAITIGGLFLPRRALFAAAALSIACVAALVYAEIAGWLPRPNYVITPSHWVFYGLIIASVALVLAYMRSLMVDLVRRQKSEIAQREKADAALQRSEARFRQVFESSPVGMTVTRVADGRYVEANRANESTLGYTREETIGRTSIELGIWASAAERERAVAGLRDRKSVRAHDMRMRNKAGETVDCRIWAETVELDGEECIITSTINVTEQERAEHQRRQSEAKFQGLFEISPEGIAVTRWKDAVLIEANDTALAQLGLARQDAIGQSVLKLHVGATREDNAVILAQLDAEGRVLNRGTRFRRHDGGWRELLLSAVTLTLDGERCVLWSWRDQTEELEQQRALTKSEERFAKAFQASREAIAISSLPEGRLISVNRQLEELYGAPAASLIGKTALELRFWADGEVTRDRIAARMRNDRKIRDMEVAVLTSKGEPRTCEYSAEIIALGGAPHVIGFLRDVSAQREQQRALADSEERFAKAFQSSQDAIGISHLPDGRLVSVNRRFEALYGAPAGEIVGKTAMELGLWGSATRELLLGRLEAEGKIRDVELQIVTRSGEMRSCAYSAEILELGGERHAIAFVRDITDQRRAEDERRQALERFAAAFTNSPDGIVISRLRDGAVVAVNDAWVSINGIAREAVIGRTLAELGIWPSEERSAYVEKLNREGRVSNFLATLRRADGGLRQTLLSAIRVDMDGEPCVMSLGRDITDQKRAEEEVRSSQRLLETVIDAIPMSIFAKDVNSNYIMINKRNAEFFGLPKEALLRRHTSQAPMNDVSRAKSLEDDQWVFKNLRALDQAEVLLAGANGTPIPFHSTKIPLFDDGGRLMGLLGVNRDISDEKRAQKALRESEHRYRSLFQAAMDCILVISPAGAVLDINEFGCRSLGYSREDLIGGTFTRILEETKLARLLPRPPLAHGERRSLRAEQEVRARDGSLRAVEFTAGPLPDGNILVVARDVTERRRNETLLDNIAKSVSAQTGAEFFRTLVTALCRELPADVVFIGEAVGAGDRVRTIACCSDGELIENFEYPLAGSPCVLAMEKRGTVVHPQGAAQQFPDDAGLAHRNVAGYAGTSLFDVSGKALGILVALTRKPIERKEFFVSMLEIFAARAAGEIERARADATVRELNVSLERRVRARTAELETANRDLDSFGYSVSHDLRAPLGALNGFAHLLRVREAERLSADGAHLLRQLEDNALRMTSLVEGLLEFSRLGRKPVTRIAVPMAELVKEVVDELGAAIGDRRVEFRIGPIAGAYGDPVLLRQVWRNLIGNAVKYSRGRDPAVIEIGSDPASGEYFVRDNGAGFDVKYAARLFGVFERLHSESEFEGTGIGLAIVQRVVNRHGGEVRGEGHPDRGATFRFTLPSR